jgi:hypothetical protein
MPHRMAVHSSSAAGLRSNFLTKLVHACAEDGAFGVPPIGFGRRKGRLAWEGGHTKGLLVPVMQHRYVPTKFGSTIVGKFYYK